VEEFRVLDSTGEEAGSPRDLLKSLYAFRAFDPLAFEAAKPKERGEIIRRLVGLDFTGLEQDRKKLFEQRTLVNRDLKAAEARRAAITYPPTTPDERMSIGKLSIDKDMAQENNRNIKENVTKLESLKSQHTKLSEEVKKLEDRLVQIASTMVSLNTSIAEQEDTVRKGVTIDVSAIQAQIEQADTINMAVEKKQTAKKLDAEIQRFSVESEKASVRIEGIDNNKLKMLAEAKWPLPGMSVDEDGVMLDGLPFEQASKAQRVLASVKVGMALNPKLRLLVCQDGNDLDNDTMAVLEQELKANDFQLLLEVVTKSKEDEDRCSVVFVDGVQSGTEPEESDDSEDEELVDTETELADLDA
jgi:septal ring factor EnvC (AmiA/AmiB activator)